MHDRCLWNCVSLLSERCHMWMCEHLARMEATRCLFEITLSSRSRRPWTISHDHVSLLEWRCTRKNGSYTKYHPRSPKFYCIIFVFNWIIYDKNKNYICYSFCLHLYLLSISKAIVTQKVVRLLSVSKAEIQIQKHRIYSIAISRKKLANREYFVKKIPL